MPHLDAPRNQELLLTIMFKNILRAFEAEILKIFKNSSAPARKLDVLMKKECKRKVFKNKLVHVQTLSTIRPCCTDEHKPTNKVFMIFVQYPIKIKVFRLSSASGMFLACS